MASTLLSTILSRMDRFQSVASIEERFKVRDLDDAIRTLARTHNLPFLQKKTSLKVFSGVYEYPVTSDHRELVFLERPQSDISYGQRLRARYTSLKQFIEDPDYRNQIAEIWDTNTMYLGVKDKNGSLTSPASQLLDSAGSVSNYTASGDASDLRLDNVNFKDGSASVAFTVTASSGTSTVSDTFTGFTDSNYQRKFYFRWVYFSSAPTSVTLRFGVDSSNYLYSTVTTQFSGKTFTANQWNLLAFDLNSASTTGTISSSSVFAYEATILTGAASGTYNLDASYLRSWELLDYWYVSRFSVATTGNTVANQEFFYNSSDVYATDSALVGETEWADVIMYTALEVSLLDKENMTVLAGIKEKKDAAWQRLTVIWPDLKPNIVTSKYNFSTNFVETLSDGTTS